MAVIPPDLLDRIRRLEEEVRELRGRLPAPPADETEPAEQDGSTGDEPETPTR
ncbi:hypothetical protein SSP35_03_03010 [Streptomyces sp. NBRC 110611]|uniref:hypothetical protein n=1 Tax=Streptomyces sp. NBRC 110611 TaxID=1621259 RepID=UPI000856DB16|nr:hypothetical protein [Streptomyces sp. NBRC 110611]GAU66653.1 hypothetical protein SSP35_03_03010 [Streptomyces sp. NBRC 110611]